jgi:hypothetical protein
MIIGKDWRTDTQMTEIDSNHILFKVVNLIFLLLFFKTKQITL